MFFTASDRVLISVARWRYMIVSGLEGVENVVVRTSTIKEVLPMECCKTLASASYFPDLRAACTHVRAV